MFPSTLENLRESLADWQAEKQAGHGLACVADELMSMIQEKIISLELLHQLYTTHGLGLTLKHRNREAWCVLTEDASAPGRYRWTQFQRDGFTGHCTHDTPELCLGDMMDDGYTVLDQGALERLCGTPEWQRGSEITAIIQACNAGLMSWEEANRKAVEVKQRYQEAA
jgi:hypothetical protein